MKTKYILHGGFIAHLKQEDDAFFSEVLRETGQNVIILLTLFASTEERIPSYIEEDKEQFIKNKGERILYFEIAKEETFLKQVRRSDVVYFHGGKTSKLLNVLKKFPKLEQSFRDKTIAGDSAGAKALSKIFYSERTGISEGLGILPIKLICHFEKKMQNVFNHTSPKSETVKLKEYEFKVLYPKIS